jgi:hypothetical protein
MSRHLQKIILLLTLLILFTGCLSKKNGKYHSKYSYHPYYSLYAKKMSNIIPKKKIKTKSKKSKPKSKFSVINISRFPNGSNRWSYPLHIKF